MANANSNFPLTYWEVDFTQGPPTTANNRLSINAPYRRLAVRSADIVHGRQYELDQVQAGAATVNVTDPTELLTPSNSSSPFNTGANKLLPYRCFRVGAMWPNQPGSGNIMNVNVNSNYDPSFELHTVGTNYPGGWGIITGTTTITVTAAQHFVGAQSVLVTQSSAGVGPGAANTLRTVPGVDYTMSVYVYPTNCSVQMQVVDGNGVTHSSAVASTLNTWTRLTMSWTCVETLELITVFGTGASTPTFYMDATMLEFGLVSPSTFVTTGPTLYMLHNGYVERWPTLYDMSGKRAYHPLQSVDGLAVMSRTAIAQSYFATINADGPQLYLPLSDTAAPGRFAIGGQNFLSTPSPTPTGSFNWGGDKFLDGTDALVMTQKNQFTPPASGGLLQDTEWNITAGTFSVKTTSATFEVWCKYNSGLIAPLQAAVVTDGKTVLPDQQYVQTNSAFSGRLGTAVADNLTGSNGGSALPAGVGYNDGVWHYIAVTLYASGAFAITFDGYEADFGVTPVTPIWGVNNIHFGVSTGFGNPDAQMSVCNWAYYPRDIGSGQRNKHYLRGVGNIGELSGARVQRLINQYWNSTNSIAGGQLALAADFDYNTRTLLDVIQEIQESERGLAYINTAGSFIFEDRTSRYLNQVALWTFGENAAGGELPYTDIQFDYDPTYTFSQCNLSRPLNSNFAPVVNATAQTNYGQRILSQTLQCNTDFDLTQAGIFYLARYAQPITRISKLTLDPSSNPALWPAVLSLEISQRVTVKRRSDFLTISGDYYIEQIDHHIDAEQGTWTTDLQLSPVFVPTAWVCGDTTYGVLGTTTVPVY
jgi:hypothetical protein